MNFRRSDFSVAHQQLSFISDKSKKKDKKHHSSSSSSHHHKDSSSSSSHTTDNGETAKSSSRPKTVKTAPSKFRSTGNEIEKSKWPSGFLNRTAKFLFFSSSFSV